MLDHTVANLLSQQVNNEFFSAYLYLGFSNYYKDEELNGFSNWYHVQAQEELDHAMLFVRYLQNNNASFTLEAIQKPDQSFEEYSAPLAAGLSHEQQVTAMIHTIYDAAHQVKDFRTMQFLDWFVKEQGEEEQRADELIKRFRLFGGDPKGLYMLDTELGARVYAAPTLVL